MEEFTADPYSITFTNATNTDYMPNPLQRHKSFNPMDKICRMIGLSLYQGSYTLLQFSERLSNLYKDNSSASSTSHLPYE